VGIGYLVGGGGLEAGDLLGGAVVFGLGTGNKVFFDVLTTITSQSAGGRTDSDFDEVGGRVEVVGILGFQKKGDDFIPDGRGAGDTGGDLAHGLVIVVADPSGYQIILGVTDGPVVTHAVGSAGFDSDFLTGDMKNRMGAKSLRAGKIIA